MSRPRYPSDDARLRRPSGITVAFSVMNPDPDKPGHSEVFEDPEKRGIWTGLLLVAGQAYAGRTGDRVTLSSADLTWVTGRTHRGPALGALRVVCGCMGYAVEDRGRSVVVHVKNLSQNQGWTPQTPRSHSATPSASESESESESDSDLKSLSVSLPLVAPEPPPPAAPAPEKVGSLPLLGAGSDAAPPRAPKEKRGKRAVPSAMKLEEIQALEQWTRTNLPSELPNVRAHVDACLDHFRANGKMQSDWLATCRNWIRRAPEMRRQPLRGGQVAPVARATPSDEENLAASRRWREETEQRRARAAR